MAEVYLAVLEGAAGFEKRLALKKILPTFGDMEEFTQLFKDEARISVTLNHSHIVQVFDFGIHKGEHFIAMEYVDGPDLEKVLLACRKLRHPLAIDALLYVATRVAGALEYAHSRTDDHGRSLELVHRDVSPPNVLLSVQGEVKITDFGVARYAQKISKSRPGVVRGKYAYMSPEQLMGEEIDSRSDLFSLGAVLYEMLTLTSPFLGETDYQTMEAVVTAQPPSPLELRRDAPRDLVRIIRKCLRRNPDERYQSAGALRRDLAELMFNRGVIDDPLLLLEELWTLFPKQLKRRGAGTQAPKPEIAPAAGVAAVGAPRMRSGPGVAPPQPDWGPAPTSGPAVIGPGDRREPDYDDDDDDLTMPMIGNPDAIPTQPIDGHSHTFDQPAGPVAAAAPDPFAATAPQGPAHGRVVVDPDPYAGSGGGTDETIPMLPSGRAALAAEAARLAGGSTFEPPEPLAAAPFKPTDKLEPQNDLAQAAALPPLAEQDSSHPLDTPRLNSLATRGRRHEPMDPHEVPAPGMVAPPTAVTTPSAALADVQAPPVPNLMGETVNEISLHPWDGQEPVEEPEQLAGLGSGRLGTSIEEVPDGPASYQELPPSAGYSASDALTVGPAAADGSSSVVVQIDESVDESMDASMDGSRGPDATPLYPLEAPSAVASVGSASAADETADGSVADETHSDVDDVPEVTAPDSTRELFTAPIPEDESPHRRISGEVPVLKDRTLDDDDGPSESSPFLLVVAALVVLGVVLFGVKMLTDQPAAERFDPTEDRTLRAGSVEEPRGAVVPPRPAAPEATPVAVAGAEPESDAAAVVSWNEPDAERPEPLATPTPRPTPQATPAPRATPTPRPTPRATPTPRPTSRATPTPRPTPRSTPPPRPTPGQPAAPRLSRPDSQPVVAAVERNPTPEPAALGIALKLNSQPPGADLTVDGQKVGAAPFTLRAEPGDIVEVTARLDGYLGTTRMLRVGPADESRTIELSAAPTAAADKPGSLRITSTPWAYVTVDGRILGQVTPLTLELPPGEHSILLENPELGWSERATVTVEAGKTATLNRRR